MPKNDSAVANPPAGGPQAFASTNDDNINDVLHNSPHVVTIAAHGQLGVVARFASKADAEASAAAFRVDRPAFVEIDVVKENDPENGLPAKLAEVEGAELAAASPPEDNDRPKGDEPKPEAPRPEAPKPASSRK